MHTSSMYKMLLERCVLQGISIFFIVLDYQGYKYTAPVLLSMFL